MNKRHYIMIIIQIYLALTLLIYEFGPIRYNTQNKALLYFLLFMFQLALFLGYYVANRITKNGKRKKERMKRFNTEWINNNIEKIIIVALVISIFYSIMWMVRYSDTFSPMEIVKNIVNGIVDPSKAYYKNMEMNTKPQIMGSLITVTSTLLVGFYYIGVPLGVYFFKKFKRGGKILVCVAIVLEIATYIMKGTNIGVFRMGFAIIPILILKWSQIKNKNSNKSKKKVIIKIVSVVILMVLIVSYFAYSTTDRMGNKIPTKISNIPIDSNNVLLNLIPDSFKYAFIMVDFYLTQGYCGMSIALNYDFQSTFGIGNSTFLTENIEDIFHTKIYERTYQSRMKEVWNDRVNWSTAYTWFANDISFIGVIPLMFLLGWMLYKVIEGASRGNIFAIALIPLYTQMIIFLPANNSMLANPMTFMPFFIIHVLWLITGITKGKPRGKEVTENEQ